MTGLRIALLVCLVVVPTRVRAFDKPSLYKSIDSRRDATWQAALKIWGWAEPGYQETKSSALLSGLLEQAGFDMRRGVAGIPTAFTATFGEGKPVIVEIQRISRPGRRVYSSVEDIPRIYSGLGISIISTPRGVLSDIEARKQNVGGEILCRVF